MLLQNPEDEKEYKQINFQVGEVFKEKVLMLILYVRWLFQFDGKR